MQVTQTPTRLRVAAVRSEHIVALVFAVGTLLLAAYAAGELTRAANATYGMNEGIVPLILSVYLLLPLVVRRLQPSRFSPGFRFVVVPALMVIQAGFTIYRQSTIVFNGDEYLFDVSTGEITQNGEKLTGISHVEAVELYRNTFPTIGDTFNIKLALDDGALIDVGFAVRSTREANRVSARIARFLNVPLYELGDGLDDPDILGQEAAAAATPDEGETADEQPAENSDAQPTEHGL